MIHAISQAMARIDLIPDSILIVIIAIGFFAVAGLMTERDPARKRRWAANADISRVLELRKTLDGWAPPAQKHARERKAS